MGQIVPDAVEGYLSALNTQRDAMLDEIAARGAQEGLPLIDAEVGALLRVLALATGAQRILEIGTAIGYSGIWLARALPAGGMLFTVEMNPDRAAVARENFVRAGLGERVNVLVGDARRLIAKMAGPFDLIFQDADKEAYSPMLDKLVALLRPGGLLVTDNVLWDGEVVPGFVEPPRRDPASTRAISEYNMRLNDHPELLTATIPLRDGVAVSIRHVRP